jgi:hypothetical protein
MNISPLKTLKQIERKLGREDGPSPEDLKKAYDLTLRLRSQLLSVIYDLETFGTAGTDGPRLALRLCKGETGEACVTLTIREPLPPLKELTAAVEEHWLRLMHTAIASAAQEGRLPYFEKAFVWLEVVTPRGSNNARLWDTSNRAVNLVINSLKGVFFKDDNHEHMAFGVAGSWGKEGVTTVRNLPFDQLEHIRPSEIAPIP